MSFTRVREVIKLRIVNKLHYVTFLQVCTHTYIRAHTCTYIYTVYICTVLGTIGILHVA
jgi:hypothetical protein